VTINRGKGAKGPRVKGKTPEISLCPWPLGPSAPLVCHCGTADGNVATGEAYGGKQHCCRHRCDGIERLDTEEQCAGETTGCGRQH
jgi:hypothetical protein